jgi:hypothetical protein
MFGCRNKHHRSRRDRRRRGDTSAPDPQQTEDMIAFVEQHLGITATQREAWEQFTETVRDSADAMQIARGAVDDGAPGALQRFARFEVVADAASAALRRIRPALEGLYRTLDKAQRNAFDDLFPRGSPKAYGAEF